MIHACSLDRDLDILPFGDMTEVSGRRASPSSGVMFGGPPAASLGEERGTPASSQSSPSYNHRPPHPGGGSEEIRNLPPAPLAPPPACRLPATTPLARGGGAIATAPEGRCGF